MERDSLLLYLLEKYGRENWYPFHMPGHKRLVEGTVLEEMGSPFEIDITEIQGFDNLHHAIGILKKSMEWAASVYGSDRTWYLVNGSSGGILSAISAAARPGGSILVARNCHKAVYHGVILNGLKIHYLYPQIIPRMGIQGGISPLDVEKALKKNPDVNAVVIVSPTYDGVVSDVREIARVVHRYGLPLIVDEAHGAHFSFGTISGGGSVFPESAVTCGADLVIQSLHKTLPSLTQTAVLHLQGDRIDTGRLERYLQIYESSSPSYVFLAGIEACIFEMESTGRERMQAFAQRLKGLRKRLLGMSHLVLLDEKTAGRGMDGKKQDGTREKEVSGHSEGDCWGKEVSGHPEGDCHGEDTKDRPWYALDRSRIVVSCKNCVMAVMDGGEKKWKSLSGEMLMERLREDYHLELEMCGADYVVAITTVMDGAEGLERLADGFLELDAQLKKSENICRNKRDWEAGQRISGKGVMTIAEALDAQTCGCLLERSAGCISAEFVYLYPPGIPILVPGERITEQVLEKILEYKELNLPIQGMEDRDCRILKIVDNSWEF